MKHERKTKDEFVVEEKVAGTWVTVTVKETTVEVLAAVARLRGRGKSVRWKRRMVPK